jgi:hypothetical protein
MAQYKIEDVEGIGPTYGEKLRAAGVGNTDQLLSAGKTKKGRAELAQKTGISESLILKWVNMVDLYRIKGIGPSTPNSGGFRVARSSQERVPPNLETKMSEVNAQKKLTRACDPGDGDGLDRAGKKLPAAWNTDVEHAQKRTR